MAVCACGAEMSARSTRCGPCWNRIAQANYQRTAKGQATRRRYRLTAKGKRVTAKCNQHRVFIGATYRGRVANADTAATINQHIQERVREFKQRFAHGEKAEGVHAGQVSPEAAV
jgi:hypothetical protein